MEIAAFNLVYTAESEFVPLVGEWNLLFFYRNNLSYWFTKDIKLNLYK